MTNKETQLQEQEIDDKLEDIYQKVANQLAIKPHVIKGQLWWKKPCRESYQAGFKDGQEKALEGSKIKGAPAYFRKLGRQEAFKEAEEIADIIQETKQTGDGYWCEKSLFDFKQEFKQKLKAKEVK
jgi:hypothetical protein